MAGLVTATRYLMCHIDPPEMFGDMAALLNPFDVLGSEGLRLLPVGRGLVLEQRKLAVAERLYLLLSGG